MCNETDINPDLSETLGWLPPEGAIAESQYPGDVPWGATPGRLYDSEITISHQSAVRAQAEVMLSEDMRPPYITSELAQYIELIYWSREANRNSENTDSYTLALDSLDTINDPEKWGKVEHKLQRANFGRASSGEVLDLVKDLDMDSAELAKLTHVYGYRIEYLEDMRKEIVSTVLERGGEVYDDPKTEYKIVSFDTSHTLKDNLSMGIAMSRKKQIGSVDGSIVYERTTYVVRIDNGSNIDPKVADYLKSISSLDPVKLKQEIMNDGRLVQEAIRLMALDDFESVIPMSTTAYASNTTNQKRHSDLRREEGEKRRHANWDSAPACHRAAIRTRMGDIATGSGAEFATSNS